MAYGQSETGLMPAIFLDRDGVLNRDPGYVHKPEDLELFPEVAAALRALRDMDFRLIVISNQSGIGRGLFTQHHTDQFHSAIQTTLRQTAGVEIDAFYYCPHLPDDGCDCRKPKPTLVDQAIKEHGIDRQRSWFVGDRDSDIECAENAGIHPVFLDRAGGQKQMLAVETVPDLTHFVDLVKKKALVSSPGRAD